MITSLKNMTFSTAHQRTVKNRNLQTGSKSTNHREECDLFTPIELILFTATLIENATVGGDLNFSFRMLLKGAVKAWSLGDGYYLYLG